MGQRSGGITSFHHLESGSSEGHAEAQRARAASNLLAQVLVTTALERAAAATKLGETAAREYEEIRRRRESAPDYLARHAYERTEHSMRTSFDEYARALDQAALLQIDPGPAILVALGRPVGIARPNGEPAAGPESRTSLLPNFLFAVAEQVAQDSDVAERAAEAFGNVLPAGPAGAAEPAPAGPNSSGAALDEPLLARLAATGEALRGAHPPPAPTATPEGRTGAFARELRGVADLLEVSVRDLVTGVMAAGMDCEGRDG